MKPRGITSRGRRVVVSTVRGMLNAAAARPRVRHRMEQAQRELQRATRGDDVVKRSRLAAIEESVGPNDVCVSLNRLCRPDAWDDPRWLMFNRALQLPVGEHRFHRKAFEWTHCVYGLEQLGALTPEARVLGVAAGHECVLYYMANRVREVVATDLYDGAFAGGLAAEADPTFLSHPERYAPFPYHRSALRAESADALSLPFSDNEFDVVYSLSSIEHFGGHTGSAQGMREMARVVRPGGVCCISTEWILEGGDDGEFFTPDSFHRYVLETPGLELIDDAIDDRPPDRALIDDPVWTDGDVEKTPHMVMGRGRLRWTSVVVFLRKEAPPG